MMDSSSSMDPSPKHLTLPCLGSHRPFLETLSSSISSVLPPISSMKDCPLPSPHKVSSADVISFLKANDSIKFNNMTSKGEHCPSIPKIILNIAINARNGHSALNGAVVAEAKGVLSSYPQTLTFAANLGNNGGLEDSSTVAPPKKILGKVKGIENQCNRSEKLAPGAHRPDQLQLVLSTYFGNIEKPASKGTACPFANVEGQIVQLEKVSSLRNSELPHTKGIFVTPSLLTTLQCIYRGNHGLQEVFANDKEFSFFKFSDDKACSNVLESGPWLFVGRMVILKKWHPRLILTRETYSKIPVWVKLFNIPHEYWNEEGLSHIASVVGKPLYADSLTESMKRISYARVCIEIDAICELVDSFDLFMGDNSGPNLGESVEILVEYQWKPKICTECKSFGHSIITCPKLKPLHPPYVMDFDPKPKQEWRRVTKGVATQIPLPCMNLEPLPLDEVISAVNSEIEPYLCPTNLPIKIQCNDLSKESIVDISNKFSTLNENGFNAPSKESVIDCSVDNSPTTASPDHSLWLSRIKNIDEVHIIRLSSHSESSSNKKEKKENKKKRTAKKGKDNSSQAKVKSS
ncbi:hypothetical protein Dsin_018635 [Dipteronia sinensis]|uniref:DUF4283 domain-containing protein n=1 Tax=Dipteronia sinensis TaxID=43782 RepID=A0AAE0A6I5_9ROSI|nr:hypothetical protein Dsin_018635 [Dipteronia sinensis]